MKQGRKPTSGCDECGDGQADARSLRCHCGSLLARRVPEGVELKCRRCKRTVVIPLEGDGTSD